MIDLAVRYREFVDGGLLAVYDSSVDGRLLACNAAFARIIGFPSAAEAIGSDLTPFYANRGQRMQFINRIRAEGRVQDVRGKLRTRAGTIVHVLLTGVGDFDAEGQLVGVHGHLIDITEGIEAQRELADRERQFAERLAQSEKIETVGRLAGGIAHDFNNLLTAILGYAELLQSSARLGDVERGDVEEIRKAGQRAATLTQQLLAFSRRQVLMPEDVDLNETVANLQTMLGRLIREDITLTCDLAPQPAIVRIDPAQIEQALLNLVLNARDALPAGGCIRLSVTRVNRTDVELPHDASPLATSEFVRLRVSDTGVGIAPEALPHLFEPFFTTKDVSKGAGLGLASVHGIVNQSNGFIAVDSWPDRGSTFSLYFPAAADRRAEHTAAERTAANGGQETILLVEDEDAVRAIISAVLRRNGYRVLEAPLPSVACELFDAHRDAIDLLLTDVVMPEMTGPALAQRLGEHRPDLRILFISGYADAVGPLDDRNPNVSFLGKPFQGSVLAGRVRELLARTPEPHTRTVRAGRSMETGAQ
jgi:two-component system, cell cycle sensor histidine kinase and response regulator CckA